MVDCVWAKKKNTYVCIHLKNIIQCFDKIPKRFIFNIFKLLYATIFNLIFFFFYRMLTHRHVEINFYYTMYTVN